MLTLSVGAGCDPDAGEAVEEDGTLGGSSSSSAAESSQGPGAGETTGSGTDEMPEPEGSSSTGAPVDTDGSSAEAVFVAVDGDDAGPGTLQRPFATFERAFEAVEPGDTVYVRGGVYARSAPVVLDRRASAAEPIRLWAYEDELPILDFADNPRHADPPQPRDDDSIAATSNAVGLLVAGEAEGWHVRGLEIRNAPYYGVRVYGSHNVFERLVLHDHKAAGLEITGKDGWSPTDNLVLDSDSFHNFDPQTDGEDADGFAAKFDTLGPGNVFRRTRAWSNADDGYDFWHAGVVVVEDCWAFDNGFNRPEWDGQLTQGWRGDGMGFKLGQDAGEIELHRVVAFGNKGFGVDDNGNGSAGGVVVYNATLVDNGANVQISLDDGAPHTVRNSIALHTSGGAVTSLSGPVDSASNSWELGGATAADFVDLDLEVLFDDAIGPRGPDGALPELGLRLAKGSALIDSGQDVGLPYEGAAPDLGAFEHE